MTRKGPRTKPKTKRYDPMRLAARAINAFGKSSQILKMMEECGELTSAIARNSLGQAYKQSVRNEIADVYLVLLQMVMVYGYDECVDALERKAGKLERLVSKHEGKSKVRIRR